MTFCISGQMRSGKNVTGEYLCKKVGLRLASFARPVKEIFCNTFGVDMDFVEHWKVIDSPPPAFKKTVRQSLQFIGDGFRSINSNVWVDYAFTNNPKSSCYTDGRYLNEIERIRLEGGFNVLLFRPTHQNNDPNESEAQIKRVVDCFLKNKIKEGYVRGNRIKVDCEGFNLIDFFIVNEGSLEDLQSKIDSFVLPHVYKEI